MMGGGELSTKRISKWAFLQSHSIWFSTPKKNLYISYRLGPWLAVNGKGLRITLFSVQPLKKKNLLLPTYCFQPNSLPAPLLGVNALVQRLQRAISQYKISSLTEVGREAIWLYRAGEGCGKTEHPFYRLVIGPFDFNYRAPPSRPRFLWY